MVAMRFGRMFDRYWRVDRQVTGARSPQRLCLGSAAGHATPEAASMPRVLAAVIVVSRSPMVATRLVASGHPRTELDAVGTRGKPAHAGIFENV
jgi:hypothetical protein